MSITFLFGSGADTDACSELKSGQSFAETLLLERHKSEVGNLLGEDYTSFHLIYPSSSKVFVQTIYSYSEEAKGILDDVDIKNFKNYYKDKTAINYNDVIKPKCSEFYRKLKSNDDTDKAVKDYFLRHAVFFDSLDEKFNSLRYSELNDNAKRVINAYTSIFVLMLKSLYKLEDFDWKYHKVFELLTRDYDIKPNPNSYYQLLKKADIDCNVITTNYTNLAENETGHKTTYLHGKLTWFEDLETLSIYDCTNEEERNHLMEQEIILPFILIPSGVKPLICHKQIKQFGEFIDKLENSNELCVVGYKFNSEDNHINSIISEWLRKDNHRLTYFNYKRDVKLDSFSWLKGISQDKIQNINIKENNSREIFFDYLKTVAKEGM